MSDQPNAIRRADFPPQTQLQGMAAQASAWLLIQIAANEMSSYEALAVVGHLLETVTRMIGLEDLAYNDADDEEESNERL